MGGEQLFQVKMLWHRWVEAGPGRVGVKAPCLSGSEDQHPDETQQTHSYFTGFLNGRWYNMSSSSSLDSQHSQVALCTTTGLQVLLHHPDQNLHTRL